MRTAVNIISYFRTAFPTWIIANLLSIAVLFYAGVMFVITGGLMLISIVIWSTIRWGHQPLVIPFEDASLTPHYGPSFWLVVSGGESCLKLNNVNKRCCLRNHSNILASTLTFSLPI